MSKSTAAASAATASAEELALWQQLEERAAQAGIDALGVTDAQPLLEAAAVIEQVKSRGLHAGMYFTFTNPQRSTTPELILPGARSVIVGARSYSGVASQRTGASQPTGYGSGAGTGAVAAYVVEDQYGPLAESLETLADILRSAGEQACVVLDDNRLVDRAVAYRAGLGWFGRNTMLLHPQLGSWTVLGAVVTTAVLPTTEQQVPDGCGSCRRCEQACPTGALSADPDNKSVLDANRCLAWLLQADGVFPREFRVALGDRLYGCDDCQTVCPYNEPGDSEPSDSKPNGASEQVQIKPKPAETKPAETGDWARHRGDNELSVRGRSTVDLARLLLQSDEQLMAGFGHWYIPRRQPEYLRRNALLVLANTATATNTATVAALKVSLANPSPIVRSHAVWAATRLNHTQLIQEALAGDLLANDPAGIVAAELAPAS